jgi:hypothetical protein
MKPPVGRICIFCVAVRTEREIGHRGVVSLVGHTSYDRVARAAVDAGCEWIAKAPVVWVCDFATAIGTHCYISRYHDIA